MGQYEKFKHEVLAGTRWLSEQGYFGKISSGGNVSVRMAEQSLAVITPSGKPYLQLTEGDVCVIDFDRHSIEGPLPPSIEAGMHIGVYQNRADVNAVIHTHQPFASVLSIISHPIPSLFDEIIVEIGPVVELIPYAFSGSQALVDNVVDKLHNHCHCYLIQNHGALCLGADMQRALKNVELLENVARIYYHALVTGREISTLPQAALDHFAPLRKLRCRL